MIGFLLGLPSWAALLPLPLTVLAAGAVLYAVPQRLWRGAFIVLGGLAVGTIMLLLFRAAYQRGTADCTTAHAEAAARQGAADQSRTDQADETSARAQGNISTVERHYVERVREVYRDRPAGPCLDADGLRRIREADAATARAAAGNGPVALLPPALAENGDEPGGGGSVDH